MLNCADDFVLDVGKCYSDATARMRCAFLSGKAEKGLESKSVLEPIKW